MDSHDNIMFGYNGVLGSVLHRGWDGFVVGFVVRGDSPGCRLISTASMLE